jgi:competence protein ComEA
MNKHLGSGTRWFALSGGELLVLGVAAAVALGVAGIVRLADIIRPADECQVREGGEMPPMPVRINVNTAKDFELEMLGGIGPKTARAIVEYREQHGPFRSLEDLMKVKNVGPKTIEAIRPHAMCAPLSREWRNRESGG